MTRADRPRTTSVVVVDDTDDIRLLLRVAFEVESDFVVVGEAGDGREAIAVAGRTRPDLVLLDLSMPTMDGLEALPVLRAEHPDATIIVLSGFDSAALGPRVLEAGADAYLQKGVAPQEIVARARRLRGDPARDTAASARPPRSSVSRWQVPAALVQDAPVGVLWVEGVTTPDAALVAANDTAAALLLLGRPPPLPLSELPGDLRRALERATGETTVLTVDPDATPDAPNGADKRRPVRLEVTVHRDADRVTALVVPPEGTLDAARLRRAIAGAAHELRNPVTVLAGAARALADGRDTLDRELSDRLLTAVTNQAYLLERATADLLTAAQQHGGSLRVDAVRVLLAPVLRDCIRAHPAAADVAVTCDETLTVRADPGRVEQMVANLLSNALKYGAAPVEVVATGSRDVVEIHVLDEGPGVADSFAPVLFDEFTREAGRGRQGTGLGLHVVRSLAKAQSGDVTYRRLGTTTDFTIRLPSGDRADERPSDAPQERVAPKDGAVQVGAS